MQFLSKDKTYAFEALRAAGAGVYSGGDIGEIVATMRGVRAGDDDSWRRQWTATADRIAAIAATAAAAGHRVSAREAFLRASNYYRNAEFFQRAAPQDDPEVRRLSRLSRETFVKAMEFFDSPATSVSIPYDDTHLPGYLVLADHDVQRPRPIVIYTNGFDSTAEEGWFAVGAAAIRRGYHVLIYDGPGQGAAIREQQLKFRPDWESVLGPVVDFVVQNPAVDARAVVHFGYSFGACLVARAAATDHRAAALILNDGLFDFHQGNVDAMPAILARLIDDRHDFIPNLILKLLAKFDTQVRWGLNNGMWTMGATSYADYIRRTRPYSVAGLAQLITTPTLILDAEDDHFIGGQPDQLAAAMTAPVTMSRLRSSEGAGEHCHIGALSLAHQRMFDWLDHTMAKTSAFSGGRFHARWEHFREH